MDEATHNRARKIIAEHPNCVLIITDEAGQPVDRVMWTAKLGEDMIVYYATGLNSAKVRRIGANPKVLVMWIGSDSYVSLKGIAEVTTDPAILDEIWRDSFSRYFPGGKTDPNYAVIRVIPEALACEDYRDTSLSIVELWNNS